ncbi:ribokinase [Pseudactinotalea sp. HY160]|uniref:ribokinase n=1 Tax=Pseudactinotalea sp. HY160 TaxID=2654490 RepID=UPI00128C4CD2|nr:ribokinase [Pseudactinotalea sp. HY160]MPV50681.1 ribokinase [Pseudactinotalea sp. HY160]
MKPDVTVVGSLNGDLIVRVPTVPVGGETTLVHGHEQGLGGKGGNQAVAAARLNAAVAMVARVGDDDAGRRYLDLFDQELVDRQRVSVDSQHKSGLAVVLLEDSGQNRILVSPGANAALSPTDVSAAGQAIRDSRVVLAQLEVPIEAVVTAFQLAEGIRILNAAPAARLPSELLDLTDVLIVNETELAAVTRGEIPANPAQAAIAAAHTGCRGTVIVTLGVQGSIAHESDGRWWHEPARPVAAVDTTAAGDAFCGALAVELGKGAPLQQAMAHANLVSAVTVTRPGAISSLPTITDLTIKGQPTQ